MHFDPKQWDTGQPYPPLGTLYAASLLRENKYSVDLFDTMFSKDSSDVSAMIETTKPDVFVIYDDGFNYLTKMCLTNMRKAAFDMCRIAKKNGCIVIVSSSDSTDRFEEYLEKGADFVLLGEAEHTLLELINSFSTNADSRKIQGIAFKQNETVCKTQRRAVIKELDELPLPAWDLINIEPYKKNVVEKQWLFFFEHRHTRGCPFKCNWCAKPIYGNRYNSRSPENVVKELIYLKEKFQFDHIWFCDDIFGLKPGWVQSFATLVQEHQLRFTFKIQSRADLLVQENYTESLALAGCSNAWMGAESGSQKILDAMDKGITVEQIHTATSLLKKNGINPSFFIQFGYLHETRKDIEKTIRMINRLLPYSIGISVSYPLPGTVFYDKVKNDLQQKTNWTDSDELQMMFRNTFKPEFYKQLHRYVHKTYRTHLALAQVRDLLQKPVSISGYKLKKALSLLYYAPSAVFAKIKMIRLEKI